VNEGLRLGGLRNPPAQQEGQEATKALSNWEVRGGYADLVLTFR
jgi:hypothetical protein